jgi:hypothetical protein
MSSPTERRLPQRHVAHCMGPVFLIDVRCPGVDQSAIVSIVQWLHWVDEVVSTYRPSSQINRLARGELSIDDCAREVREIVARCEELVVETNGYSPHIPLGLSIRPGWFRAGPFSVPARRLGRHDQSITA